MNNSSLITIALAIFISLSLPHAQIQYLCYNTDFSLNYLKSKPCSLEFFVPASGTSFQFLSKLSLQLYGDLILKLVKESQKQNSGNLIQTEGYFYKHMACISKFHRSWKWEQDPTTQNKSRVFLSHSHYHYVMRYRVSNIVTSYLHLLHQWERGRVFLENINYPGVIYKLQTIYANNCGSSIKLMSPFPHFIICLSRSCNI